MYMGTRYHSLRKLDERLAGRIPFLAEENDAIASDSLRFQRRSHAWYAGLYELLAIAMGASPKAVVLE
jgi:hypothetical protein